MRELIRRWIGLGYLRHDVELSTLMSITPGSTVASAELNSMVEFAGEFGLDREEFARELTAYFAEAATWAADRSSEIPREKAVLARIAAARSDLEMALTDEPSGIVRGETFLQELADAGSLTDSDLEAYADSAVDLTNAQRKALAQYWRDQWLEGRAERKTLGGEAFWVSRDFQDHYDDIAYFRVYERYGFGEFDELFDDVAKTVGERLIDGLASSDAFGRYQLAGTTALAIAEHVWLMSRSRALRRRLHTTALAAVTALFYAQREDGFWPAPVAADGGVHPPSPQATAMAVIAARRLSSDDRHRAQAERAVSWLTGAQQADGSWVGFRGPDVAATALALEAIARSGRPNTETVCQRAADWLVSRQQPWGAWSGSLPPTLLTVTVLEALRSASWAGRSVPDDLASALALVVRADVLALENSREARQLAVVAAYTGLEAVLYALLSHPSIGVTTIRQNGQSIGFDQALATLEAALVTQGHLASGRHVAGHNTLRGLTHVRDGVVHRGSRPSQADVNAITAAIGQFCREYMPIVFGLDPLAD